MFNAIKGTAHATGTNTIAGDVARVGDGMAAQGIVDRHVALPPAFRAAVCVEVPDGSAPVLPIRS